MRTPQTNTFFIDVTEIPPDRRDKLGRRIPLKKRAKLKPEELQVRQEMILTRRLQGKTTAQIQAEFGLSSKTVYKNLGAARSSDLFQAAKDRVLASLVPRAILLLEEVISDPEADMELRVETARDLLHGVGLLSKHGTMTVLPADAEATSFEEWRERTLKRVVVRQIGGEVVEQATAAGGATEICGAGSLGLAETAAALGRARRGESVVVDGVEG